MTSVSFILLIVVAAIAGMGSVLDEAQFHRPLVACTLTGLVLGDMTTGILIGGTLEMLALGWMNAGTAMAPDAALASVVSTILVIAGHQSIGAGIALAVPLAAAGQALTIFIRTITVFLQHLADRFALQGSASGIEMCHAAGLFLQAIRVAVPAAIVALVAGTDTVHAMLGSIPEVITRGLQVSGGFIAVVGYAMVINKMNTTPFMPYFLLGFLLAVFTNVNLIGIGAVGLICAYFHIKGLARDPAAQDPGGGTGNAVDAVDDSGDSDWMRGGGAMDRKVSKGDLISVFIRSNFLSGSFNFERMQAIGFCVSMIPALRRVYQDDPEAYRESLQRHLEFFNTQPFLATPIMGIIAAMEEKKAAGAAISDAAISGVKVGLIGPLAGAGDPIFWGTLRPVLAALGAGIALTGSIVGPLLFFVAFNLIRLLTNWYGVMYGYAKGTELVDGMGGNRMRCLTEGSSVLGLLVMGALVAKWTTVNMPLVLSTYTDSRGEVIATTVQSILDSLMPGIVPLLMTFACMYFLKKGVNPLILICGLFALGIVGYATGLFA